jgi:hypothetical protein
LAVSILYSLPDDSDVRTTAVVSSQSSAAVKHFFSTVTSDAAHNSALSPRGTASVASPRHSEPTRLQIPDNAAEKVLEVLKTGHLGSLNELPGLSQQTMCLLKLLASSELHPHRAFEALLVEIVSLFDQLWLSSSAGYMDFPYLIAEVRNRLVDALSSNPVSLSALIRFARSNADAITPTWLKQAKVSNAIRK